MSDGVVHSRVAVTGVTGLIGAAVARRLSSRSEIVSIGRRDTATLHADFGRPETVRALDLAGIDAVVHCAGIVDEDFKQDVSGAFRQATEGMAALVGRARECGVRRLLYISSAHVYGPMVGAINENSQSNPLSDYALAHFASEQILRRATCADFRGAAFRPNAVFGIPPSLTEFRRWTLIPFEFPKTLATTGRIALKSSGEQYRNFVGVEDIAQGVALWLDRADAEPMEIVNPVGKQSMSVWQFAELCANAAKGLVTRQISVTRPELLVPSPASPLDYASIHEEYRGGQDLPQTIRTLIEMLVEQLREKHDA
jgi:UDP-glucose 4-epimerase